MHVVDWAKENAQRPSIDVLFRSAANAYGDFVCGVLLSGTLDDGVAGLQAIRNARGVTIVQDPSEALFADMPRNAIAAGAVDESVATEDLGASVVRSVYKILEEATGTPAPDAATDERRVGHPSVFACPDCGGTLWESDEDGNLRFRCRTGHAYNVRTIMSAQHNALENALWTSLRILEERIDFFKRLARRAVERGDRVTSDRYTQQAEEHEREHDRLRQALTDVVTQRHLTAS
jgi:two-component system chemotaxis response regulator CheB